MKKRALVFLFLFLFVLVFETSFVFSDVSVSKLETLNKIKEINKISNKIQPQVFTELENKDSVKVIITIKENSDSRTIKTQSQEELRETIINSIGREKVKHKFSSSNSFSAKLNQADLSKLAINDNVEAVYYDLPVYAFLQDSIGIINASITLPLKINGLNLTGQGQSVCIIDTGINYSHSALGGCNIKNLSLNGNNVSYVLESDHNYSNSYDHTWKINYTGFTNIAVHFVNISLAYPGEVERYDSFDRVIIYSSNMTEIASYHGINGIIRDLWTPSSQGDTIYVRLVSDSNITDYGFYINQIINGTTNTTYNWNNCSKTIFGWDFYNNDPDPYDDQGHGTHVAGIVAANGSVTGVSPNANLVIAKAMYPSGNSASGWISDIMYAIEWCTNNSEKYNISVISMSLGEGQYNGYCDSGKAFTSSINLAVAKNISVVVATGNTRAEYPNPTAGIANPACITNSTRVTATDKSPEAYATYAFRNSNFTDIIAAPGTDIVSTMWTGGTESNQGTSMATPHVAGAIAIIRQYLALTNKTRTPKQIEIILNNTGKRIYDSGSGLTFSRIDLYSAILSLDETSPNTTLISPVNSSSTRIVNQTFTANITDDLQLKNTTFYLWNSTSLVYSNFSLLSDINQQVSFNVINLDYTIYTWNYYSCDINNNCSFSQSNFSLSVSSLVSNISIPENNTRTNQIETNFTCNSTSTQDFPLINNTLFLWNSTSLVYSETKNISGTINSSIFNISLSSFGDNVYYWNCLSTNNASSSYSDSNFTIIYDSTPPELNIINLENNTWYNQIKFNISLNEESDSCWFSLNNQDNTTINKSNSTYFYYSNLSIQTDTNLDNNMTIYCNDTLGNINTSSLIFFGIDLTYPNITLISPANSYSETTSSTSINFQFNVTDNLNLSTCSLIISGSSASITANTSAITNTTNTISKTLSSGSYTWYINCTDEVGNQANSSSRTITLTAPDNEESPGSGGGTTTTTSTSLNLIITPTQIQQGFTYSLSPNDSIKFSIKNRNHNITINSISSNNTEVTIRSNPIIINLSIGEERKLNLTNNESFDFYIKLNSINNNKANITLLEINETIPPGFFIEQPPQGENVQDSSESKRTNYNLLTVTLIIFVSLVLIIYIIRKINLYRLDLKDKNKKNDQGEKTKTKK